MDLTYVDSIQFIAWFLALSGFILALYILSLNAWHTANRHVSALLALLALNGFAAGLMAGAKDVSQAAWSTYIIAASSDAIQPVILLASVALLKPAWLSGRWRRAWALVYVLAFLPALLTLLDVTLKTELWYTGLAPALYSGGFTGQGDYVAGALSALVKWLNLFLMPVAIIIFLLYSAVKGRDAISFNRRLAWLLLAGYILAAAVEPGLRGVIEGAVITLATGTVLILVYAAAAFQQMVAEQRVHRGKLQSRLTALILATAVPIVIAVTTLVSSRAGALLVDSANEQLQATNRALAGNVSTWLRLNVETLNQLVTLPDIVSMDPRRQKPVLAVMDAAYPHLFLVHTTDLRGLNVARNDNQENKNYSDRIWYQGAVSGAPVTFQSLVSRTTGQPALSLAAPIRDESGNIVGVGGMASELDDLAQQVRASKVGETGFAYIVDANNLVIAHPDPAFSAELQDFSGSPPVQALREGRNELITFTDEEGQRWRAYVDELDNGWGVIVQQSEDELLVRMQQFQKVSWAALIVGSIILLVVAWLTIRQALRPINTLTETAIAISEGNLERTAPIESEDEVGILARTFNSMTAQLRELISELEERVRIRTQRLEVVAALGERLSGIVDEEELLAAAVNDVKGSFGYYHAHIYLLDEAGENLVVAAGAGEAGTRLKAKGHSIPLNAPTSLVAQAAKRGRVVKADNVREVKDWLPNPLLPETQSEIAVPVVLNKKVIGVLDVQQDRIGGLDEGDENLLRSVVNQLAPAMNNVRLFQQAQTALADVEALNRQLTRKVWLDIEERVDTSGYAFSQAGVAPAPMEWSQAMGQAVQQKNIAYGAGNGSRVSDEMASLAIPLTLRGEVIGVIGIERSALAGTVGKQWSEDELVTVQSVAEQVALALDSARLARETERAAWRDRVVSETTARVWSSGEMEEVMKAAVAQLGDKLRATEVVIRLGTEEEWEVGYEQNYAND